MALPSAVGAAPMLAATPTVWHFLLAEPCRLLPSLPLSDQSNETTRTATAIVPSTSGGSPVRFSETLWTSVQDVSLSAGKHRSHHVHILHPAATAAKHRRFTHPISHDALVSMGYHVAFSRQDVAVCSGPRPRKQTPAPSQGLSPKLHLWGLQVMQGPGRRQKLCLDSVSFASS